MHIPQLFFMTPLDSPDLIIFVPILKMPPQTSVHPQNKNHITSRWRRRAGAPGPQHPGFSARQRACPGTSWNPLFIRAPQLPPVSFFLLRKEGHATDLPANPCARWPPQQVTLGLWTAPFRTAVWQPKLLELSQHAGELARRLSPESQSWAESRRLQRAFPSNSEFWPPQARSSVQGQRPPSANFANKGEHARWGAVGGGLRPKKLNCKRMLDGIKLGIRHWDRGKGSGKEARREICRSCLPPPTPKRGMGQRQGWTPGRLQGPTTCPFEGVSLLQNKEKTWESQKGLTLQLRKLMVVWVVGVQGFFRALLILP